EKLNTQGVLKTIHFDFDKYDISSDAIRTLGDNASTIKQYPQFKLRIEGHCDERGTVEYNLALGEKRARAARDYLVSLGTPAQKLRIISYGKERPVDPGHYEEAWAMNRRAESSRGNTPSRACARAQTRPTSACRRWPTRCGRRARRWRRWRDRHPPRRRRNPAARRRGRRQRLRPGRRQACHPCLRRPHRVR